MGPNDREGGDEAPAHAAQLDAARKRAAVETYARNEATLRRTARRYSICEDDAEDALQRGLEILLRKAPTEDPRELIKWTQTVVKHEALAVRRERERLLCGPAGSQRGGDEDWVALIPAPGDGPEERTERREAVARSREALQSLKPQELRALTLLAEGYSYREIGEITGYSATKINRCLAEGRERFRSFLARSTSGGRCQELGPLISAFCDGEAGEEEAGTVREHLRACANCRATLRAYRAAPHAAAALAPVISGGRPLLERAQDAIAGLSARFGGGGATGDSALTQIAAAGGTRGAGMAALAKVLALCVGTVGGAAACVATGVVPDPIAADQEPAIERSADETAAPPVEVQPEPTLPEPEEQSPAPTAEDDAEPRQETGRSATPTAAPETDSGAVEYVAPPPQAVTETASNAASAAASGEFGP
ncbi:MAG TPA: sigma-70 family RNA polymerase sigma factor [Solirubrobacterales bacterium]|nr:sigma-70 family RNA polymerase sigma factor [Solirubrobacterales bacterium]